jgi:site-specific DNA-cytosine methylase
MMGLPAGWITDIVGSRAACLRCLGNSVVPQVAELIGHQIAPIVAAA